jgi:serine/threonine-protein kinase
MRRVLGCGGFGAVYFARDATLGDAPVAVKENLNPAMKEQFLREAQLLAHIPRHPNLPRVSDCFTHNGRAYLVMEYIEGRDLTEFAPLPEAKALELFAGVLAAVEHLHKQNPPTIHRDIKPRNVRVDGNGYPILVDLGIAKVGGAGVGSILAGTPGFMPIEQYEGEGKSDERTDVYALGATLYFLLTGEVPTESPVRALRLLRGEKDIASVRELNAGVSEAVNAAVMKALAVKPEDRYQSVVAFRRALTPTTGGRRSSGAVGAAGASPSPCAGEERINPKDGAVMIYIPAGEFLMGSNNGYDDEKPQRRVYLDGYWIYKYPVTVAQYRKFCRVTGRQEPPPPYWGWEDDHPIVNVSWHDAVAYCEWAGVRLPTEAEWEKAARGTDGRKYPWGNEWDGSKCANSVGSNNLRSTAPVGSYPQGVSPYGVHDMAGNVWEWCADWYDGNYYRSAPSKNPQGPSSGERRVLRGGSWNRVGENNFRAADRNRYNPDYRWYNNGFRCAARSDFR